MSNHHQPDDTLRQPGDKITTDARTPPEFFSINSYSSQETESFRQAKGSSDGFTRGPLDEDGQNLSHSTSRPSISKVSIAVAWIRHMTIFKALLILYCLNVVTWGGMVFLLLCNAAPAMCHPTCNNINSPRRKWIEIDSQILNGLFCVPAFGFAPRRSTEAWQLLRYISGRHSAALRRLAAAYRAWFRLPGSQTLPADVGPAEVELWLRQDPSLEDVVPYPTRGIPQAPLSGRRAMPTMLWKLQVVIGLNLMNMVFQAILSGFMWGYNRHTRPSWSVGLFLCLAFVSSMAAGVMEFVEGKNVKKVEGIAHLSMLGNRAEEQELVGHKKLPSAHQIRTS